MANPLRDDFYSTVEDYLAGEIASPEKHEYLAGVIYAMAGTTIGHDRIAGNIARALGNQLSGGPCEVFSSDVKVKIRTDTADFFYYPDVTVDCAGPHNASLYAENPRVIFEVLSPDTERIDRGEKLGNYQAIPSLEAYVLVNQFRVAVTVYRRAGGGWSPEFLTSLTDVLPFPSLGCELVLAAIYERTGLHS